MLTYEQNQRNDNVIDVFKNEEKEKIILEFQGTTDGVEQGQYGPYMLFHLDLENSLRVINIQYDLNKLGESLGMTIKPLGFQYGNEYRIYVNYDERAIPQEERESMAGSLGAGYYKVRMHIKSLKHNQKPWKKVLQITKQVS